MSVTMKPTTVSTTTEQSVKNKWRDERRYNDDGEYMPIDDLQTDAQCVESSVSGTDGSDEQTTMIALCGPPKSGKSTVAEVFEDEFNGTIVTEDNGIITSGEMPEDDLIVVDHVENEEHLFHIERCIGEYSTVVAVDAPELDRVERYWSDYEKDHTKPYDAHKIKNQFERLNNHFWRSEHADIAQEADFVVQNDNPYDRGFIVAQLEVLMDGLTDDSEDDLSEMYVGEIQ